MSIAISAPVVEDRFGSLASPLLLHSVSESHDHDEDDYPLNSIAKPKPTPQPSLPSSAAAAAAAATTATTLGSRLRSLPLRLINTGVSILLRIRAMLPAPVRPWFWIGLWLVFALIGLGIFAGFHTKIFELLEVTAAAIKSLGRAGPPLIMLGLFLTAFPPLVGYSSLVTMSGYVYGFGFGLFIAYTSALLGSIACFYLCRRWFKVQVRAMVAKKPNLKSVVRAVEKRGFRLMLLIRLSPYPFNIMNALFSATHIPLSSYIIATALSLTKLALHVYIGSTLSSLAVISPTPGTGTGENGEEGGTGEGTQDPAESHPVDRHSRTVKIVVMSISMILGIAVGIYVWRVAKREIEASEGIRNERRRKRRESLRQSRRLSNMQGEGRGSGRAQQHVVARTGSANSMVQSGLGQECVADIDMSALGGSHSTTPHSQRNPYHSNDDDHSSNYVGGAYPDEDEFGHEDQALVNNGSGGGYASDSEESDIPDDDDLFDDDDVSDMERGADDDMGSSQAFLAGHHPQQLQHHRRSASWQSHQDLTDLGPRSHRDNTNKGWFSQNGVDVNGRGW